ncbi:MAG: recombinase family protein [Clostridia bacterium]|nr:recombinase family protein [Clostridia bacterium]
MFIIAIYTRKSKSTDKGESIDTQIKLCQEYIKKQYADKETKIIYYDEGEGKSGGDNQRRKFQEVLKDAKKKKFHALMCYRLDRVARSVADFSDLIEELTSHKISFISVKEQFDTTTPMGRAMMYIASVFAQLEREIGAERVKDNLTELAKTGRWLGGTTPTGYESKGFEVISIKEINENQEVERKRKKVYKLEKKEEEWQLLDILFKKIEELESLTAVETYLFNHDIHTKNNKKFTRFTLMGIYRNIVYAKNDSDMYHYLKEKKIDIFAEEKDFDGRKGMIAYNKTLQKKHKAAIKNDMKDWIISVGKHEGILEGKRWIAIQDILDRNQNKRYRRPQKNKALLSGMLKCECNGYMRPKLISRRTDQYGNNRFFYMCNTKEISRKQKCNIKNIDGNELDRQLVNQIKNWSAPNFKIAQQLKKITNTKQEETEENLEQERLNKLKKKNEKDLKSLMNKIKYIDIELIEDISQEIKKIKKENKKIEKQMQELNENQSNYEIEITNQQIEELVLEVINHFFDSFNNLDIMKQRKLLKLFISSAVWNGQTVTIELLDTKSEECEDFF